MMELRRQFLVNTPLGVALVWAVTDKDTVELGMLFHTFQLETGEPWSWRNPDVRICGSNSARRHDDHTPIHLTPERLEFLKPHIARHRRSPFYSKVVN